MKWRSAVAGCPLQRMFFLCLNVFSHRVLPQNMRDNKLLMVVWSLKIGRKLFKLFPCNLDTFGAPLSGCFREVSALIARTWRPQPTVAIPEILRNMRHICRGTHGKTCLKLGDIGKYTRDVAVVSLVPYGFSSQCSSHLSGVKNLRCCVRKKRTQRAARAWFISTCWDTWGSTWMIFRPLVDHGG